MLLLAFSVIRETNTFTAGIGNVGMTGKRELPNFQVREGQIHNGLIGTFKLEMEIKTARCFREKLASQSEFI